MQFLLGLLFPLAVLAQGPEVIPPAIIKYLHPSNTTRPTLADAKTPVEASRLRMPAMSAVTPD